MEYVNNYRTEHVLVYTEGNYQFFVKVDPRPTKKVATSSVEGNVLKFVLPSSFLGHLLSLPQNSCPLIMEPSTRMNSRNTYFPAEEDLLTVVAYVPSENLQYRPMITDHDKLFGLELPFRKARGALLAKEISGRIFPLVLQHFFKLIKQDAEVAENEVAVASLDKVLQYLQVIVLIDDDLKHFLLKEKGGDKLLTCKDVVVLLKKNLDSLHLSAMSVSPARNIHYFRNHCFTQKLPDITPKPKRMEQCIAINLECLAGEGGARFGPIDFVFYPSAIWEAILAKTKMDKGWKKIFCLGSDFSFGKELHRDWSPGSFRYIYFVELNPRGKTVAGTFNDDARKTIIPTSKDRLRDATRLLARINSDLRPANITLERQLSTEPRVERDPPLPVTGEIVRVHVRDRPANGADSPPETEKLEDLRALYIDKLKGARIVVRKGKHNGKEGVVKKFNGSNYYVDLDGEGMKPIPRDYPVTLLSNIQ